MSTGTKYINLVIADRNYRLKIATDEEALVMKACEQIKTKLSELKQSYRVKDRQDYLAMAALTLAVDALKKENSLDSLELVEDELDKTSEILSNYLKAIE